MTHKIELQFLQCEIPSYAQLMLKHLLIFLICETEVCIPIKSDFPVNHSAIFSNTINVESQKNLCYKEPQKVNKSHSLKDLLHN